ncbi:MAG TPA: hypothetical protein VF395_04455, partial [Polyangiaceae bacterium]
QAGVRSGLVFVETDHGFSLGHDPAISDANTGVVVARRRHDAHDAILWERLGHPRTYAYDFRLGADDSPVTPHVSTLTPMDVPFTRRFEAEAEWPPLSVRGGSVLPVFPPCASGHRALHIEPSGAPEAGEHRASVRVEIAVPRPGRYRIASGWVASTHGVGATLAVNRRGVTADSPWTVQSDAPSGTCVLLLGPAVQTLDLSGLIDISCDSDQVLDYLELSPEP